MGRPRARHFGGLVALATIVGALASAGPALATTSTQTISSSGPLTGLIVGNDLDCQVQYAGWSGGGFYPTASVGFTPATADCGTFISIGASVYGPDFDENYASGTGISLTTAANYVAYSPGAQSAVSGSGTSASPYTVTTSEAGGESGVAVSESDRYVTGQNGFTTAITLTNTTGDSVAGVLYRAVDCYLQGSDDGYGDVESDGAVVCSSSANDASGGPAEELDPVTGGSRYVETDYNDVWGDIDAQAPLPDTCDCTINEDNAIGLSWGFSLAAGASAQYVVHTNFVATGTTPPGSGAGSEPTSGNGKETSRHKVRITLVQFARHHRTRASMSLPVHTGGERVRARLHGSGVRQATGTITYDLYRGRRCTIHDRVLKGQRRTIRHGRVPASTAVHRALRPGRYSWQAVYSGDKTLQRAKSICGRSKLIILR